MLPGLEGVVARNTATDFAFAIAIGGGVSGLAVVLLRRRLPWPYVWTCVSALTVLLTLGAGASPRGWYATVVVLVVGARCWVRAWSVSPGLQTAPRSRCDAARRCCAPVWPCSGCRPCG